MRRLLPLVDLLIANEEDCADVLRIHAGDTNVESGRLAVHRYPEVARQVVTQFPNVRRVAITLRESLSASHNNWGAMLYVADEQRVVVARGRVSRTSRTRFGALWTALAAVTRLRRV